MTRRPVIARRVEQLLGVPVVSAAPVAGGDVATAHRLRLNDSRMVFVKTLQHARPGQVAAEANGLIRLRETGTVAVPEVLAADDDCLVLDWVEPTRPSADTAAAFGRDLAALHSLPTAGFGAPADGWIARLPLPNAPVEPMTWPRFYAERRVLPYARLARDRGVLGVDDLAAVESVAGRFETLLPDEPASLVHGDLWNGNCLWGLDGRVHVVDPAVHGAHRELDLAMLSLFGLPHLARATAAYTEVAPLTDGWEDRTALHQLFPLLVHAVMFGGGYGARAGDVARRH